MSFQEENIDLNQLPEGDPEEEKSDEMGFFDHMGELRRRVIYSVIALIIGCIAASFVINDLINGFLLKPITEAGFEIQNLNAMGQPILYIKILIISGFIITFPFIVYQIWKFIEPGLYATEKNWARSIVFFTTVCFLLGLLFAYYVMIPSMLEFASGFGTSKIQNIIEINGYLRLLTNLMIAAGIFFELPVVSFILSRVGLLTPTFLRNYRRHSIVIILIVAAIITPSPDPFNQLIVAVPIYILYELSIMISGVALRQYLKKRDD